MHCLNNQKWKKKLKTTQRCFEEYDLKIKWQKTKVMICLKTQPMRKLQIQIGNYSLLQQVNINKYLDSLIAWDGKNIMKIKSKLVLANITVFIIYKKRLCSENVRKRLAKMFLWSFRNIRNMNKKKILKSFKILLAENAKSN